MKMNKLLSRVFIKAKAEGRLCKRCGWIVTVKDWQAGCTYCAGCRDAMKGVNVSWGHDQPQQEKKDITGEAL